MLMSMFLKLQVEQALHDNLPDRYSYACIHANEIMHAEITTVRGLTIKKICYGYNASSYQ